MVFGNPAAGKVDLGQSGATRQHNGDEREKSEPADSKNIGTYLVNGYR
jgi:hypothetical protein